MSYDMIMVMDLQYGSTGKGQVAGTLGRMWEPDVVVCANGPNAGHTYCWTPAASAAPCKIVHTVLPVSAVLPSVCNILLGPGAVFDRARLMAEIEHSIGSLVGKRLIIHPNATMVSERHREAEKAFVGIGSTMKGTAEAVIEKMRRHTHGAPIARETKDLEGMLGAVGPQDFEVLVDYNAYDQAIDHARRILVEGAQGHSLSMHSQFYPHCTSRDVSVAQVWADCRLPHQHRSVHVIGTVRTFPIRVANRFDEAGNMIGTSGRCYDDQEEISWESLGRTPELTTVTKLPRRIFTMSTEQLTEATRYSCPDSIALTFCDYVQAEHGVGIPVYANLTRYIRKVELATGQRVNSVSFGPLDTDMYSLQVEGRTGLTLAPLALPKL